MIISSSDVRVSADTDITESPSGVDVVAEDVEDETRVLLLINYLAINERVYYRRSFDTIIVRTDDQL